MAMWKTRGNEKKDGMFAFKDVELSTLKIEFK